LNLCSSEPVSLCPSKSIDLKKKAAAPNKFETTAHQQNKNTNLFLFF